MNAVPVQVLRYRYLYEIRTLAGDPGGSPVRMVTLSAMNLLAGIVHLITHWASHLFLVWDTSYSTGGTCRRNRTSYDEILHR